MKTLILVTGQHRSGTSATTGCLQRLGVHLGGCLMPPAHDNPKGFFEDTRVVGIHDQLLAAMGAAWDRPQDVPEDWQQHAATAPAAGKLVGIVQEFAAKSDLFAIKDPRAALFTPLWQRVCSSARVHLVLLIPRRLRDSVVRSLIARQGWSPERAREVVLGYARALEGPWTPSIPRARICFPEELWKASSWERVAGQLGVELDIRGGISAVQQFLDYGLVHHG